MKGLNKLFKELKEAHCVLNMSLERISGEHREGKAAGEVGRDEATWGPAGSVKGLGLCPKNNGKEMKELSAVVAD